MHKCKCNKKANKAKKKQVDDWDTEKGTQCMCSEREKHNVTKQIHVQFQQAE